MTPIGQHPSGARLPGQRGRISAPLARLPGLDGQGRFIGPRDIERACEYFWRAAHRRGSAPLVRGDPVFARDQAPASARARSLRRLAAADLLAIQASHLAGTSKAALARAFGVTYNTILHHLRPSPSMRQALATRAATGD